MITMMMMMMMMMMMYTYNCTPLPPGDSPFAVKYILLYAFFWVIPRRLNFKFRRFGTLFHLHRQVGVCRMNSAGGMFGVFYGKRFVSEMAFSRIIPQTFPQPSSFYTYLPAYEDGTECSETSAYKIQTPGNHPKESIQHSGHGESLKSINILLLL